MAVVMVINAALARGRLNHNHQHVHPEKYGVGFTAGVAFHRFSHTHERQNGRTLHS